jgi:hypothetical protein
MEENNTVSSDYPFGDTFPRLAEPEWNPRQALRDIASSSLSLSEPKSETRTFQPDELPGWQKTGDAANFEAAVGHKINVSTSLASEIMIQAMEKWHAEIAPDPRHPTKGNFWAGHRAGWTGLNDPRSADWEDILFYYDAVMAIKAKLDSDTEGKLTTGSTRIGVNVINI